MTSIVTEDQNQVSVVLRAGLAECEIWPKAGGSIARWTIGTQEMFRRAVTKPPEGALPLDMASFPLVPYSNRIGFGQFDFAGKAIKLEANFPPERHTIHGTGWTAKWETASVTDGAITLRHAHRPDVHWPWPFEAEQQITLSADMLTIEMSARNLSDQVVPLAFGHHPYFDSEGATLSFQADQVWLTGCDGLPSHAVAPQNQFDFANGARVQGRILDNGFADWNGRALIRWHDRPFRLEIESNMPAAVIYVPESGGYFCFEPVPHIINALNMPGHGPQMPLVEPGARFEAHIRLCAKVV